MASWRSLSAHEHETMNAPCRKITILTGPSPIQQGRYKSRKGLPRLGPFGKAKFPSFAAIVVATSPQMTVGKQFWRRLGDDEHEPMRGCILSFIWSSFWCVELQLDCRPTRRTRKIHFASNQKDYDNSETTVGKLLARRIRICRVYFLWSTFDLLIFKTSENMASTKIDPADLNTPCQILVCQGLRSFWGASDQY